MRKESIGRLLLTLLTAFVMVAGVFGAAVQTWTGNEAGEGSNQPIMEIAASEFDVRTSGTGDAPVSAINSDSNEFCEITDLWSTSSTDSESNAPNVLVLDTRDDSADATGERSMTPLDHGTRQVSVDANGPYGEQPPNGTPYLEGDTVPFKADIIGGSNDDYKFKWDVNGDEVFDGPGTAPDFWGAYGENTYDHDYKDNFVKEAKVQAWDGVSMKTLTGGGTVWDNKYPGYVYLSAGYYGTVGMKFDVTKTVTIDELRICRYYYPYQYYNIRLWDSGQNILREVINPFVPTYTWRAFSITPITITPGEYILSVGFRGYYQYGDYNPGATDDDIIDPIEWVRALNNQNGYPSEDMGGTYIPFLDLQYSFSYQVPDVLNTTANVKGNRRTRRRGLRVRVHSLVHRSRH
jgi:hypothetical protein